MIFKINVTAMKITILLSLIFLSSCASHTTKNNPYNIELICLKNGVEKSANISSAIPLSVKEIEIEKRNLIEHFGYDHNSCQLRP